MFRKDMSESLKAIFGLTKVSFAAPSDEFEQDTLFIEIDSCRTRPASGQLNARVSGKVKIYSQAEKMPFGYLAKRIENADFEHSRNFFFFDIDENIENSEARLQNIYERSVSFSYLYSTQYDPNKGIINSLDWSI